MKKLVILLSVLFCAFQGFAQTTQDTGYDKILNYTDSKQLHTGDSNELTAVGDSAWTYTYYINSYNKIIADVGISLDGLSGTPSSQSIWLTYKEMPWDSYVGAGDTVKWTTGVDTTFTLSTGATALKANYIRINYKGSNDAFFSQLLYSLIRIWK